MPFGVLFSKAYEQWRQTILQNYHPRTIIELPTNTLFPFTSIKLALLYLEKLNKKKQLETIFIMLTEKGDLLGIENQPWFKDLKDTLSGKPPQIIFSLASFKSSLFYFLYMSPD